MGAARHLPTDPAPPLERRGPSALAVSPTGPGDHRVLPAAPRGVGALHLHPGRRGQPDRAADGTPALPRLSRPTSGLPSPTEYLYGPDMLVAAGDHARRRGVDHGVVPSPASGSTSSPVPPSPARPRPPWRCLSTGCRSSSARVASSPNSRPTVERRRRTRSPPSSTRDRRGPSTSTATRERDSATPRGNTPRPSSPRRRVPRQPIRPRSASPSAELGVATRGEPTSVATTVEMIDVTRPSHVSVDGRNPSVRSDAGQHWSYQAATSTLMVDIGSRPIAQAARIVAVVERRHSVVAARR